MVDILRVYGGLDYHSDSIRVCVMTENGQELVNRSVCNDVGGVRDAVENLGPLVLVEGVAIEACT